MGEKSKAFIERLLSLTKERAFLAWTGSFFLCLFVVLINQVYSGNFTGNMDEFAVGRVADRDIIAERNISYIDEDATRLLIESNIRNVPAVFHYSASVSDDLKNRWIHFAAFAEEQMDTAESLQGFILAIQTEFPHYFPNDILTLLYYDENWEEIIRDCGIIFSQIVDRGIFSMPQAGIDYLNPEILELFRLSGTRIEQERLRIRGVIFGNQSPEAIRDQLESHTFNTSLHLLAYELIGPFLRPNIFFSLEDTDRNIAAIRANTEPVFRHIEQGMHIIRRGFVITQEEMDNFLALSLNVSSSNIPLNFAHTLFLLLLFALLYFFSGRQIIGRKLKDSEAYLVSGLTALYIIGSVLVKNITIMSIPGSILIPTALIIMLPAILIHPRLALLLAFALPLGAFLIGSFDGQSYFFALVSGVVASYSLQQAEKRMDLVKAGLLIAAANLVSMTAVLLWQSSPASFFPGALFWSGFNGIACGMLVLGFLSPLEHALKAATSFRLIELSDLNVPILRKLFTTAPGTYSHSIMVANLAETACLDIGANPLLARVGAYYHDLGKMENPDYYVENQTSYNRHDDMAPRLSATVIRSHVKLGVEKARQLKLPQEVIDIVSEHHGNSVISYFYDKALKQEDSNKAAISMDDFTYPGNPPQSKESAVVMLADVAEAAVRTLEKPNAGKIEKFIQELISRKVETDQLVKSELTFRDLEVIKNAFVRALAGYYHSRIEYPKLENDNEQS
ncbi:MAG: HDIG domain-containing protein [Treponema sp.]|nr:HDIG domain-containing protein [Treponema sp.]